MAGQTLAARGREGIFYLSFRHSMDGLCAILDGYGDERNKRQLGKCGLAFLRLSIVRPAFVLVGLGMLSAPLLPLFGADKTLFAVTDQRVIRLYLGRRLQTRSLEAGQIGTIERSEGRDGNGTVKISAGTYRDSDGDSRTRDFEIGEVLDVLKVEENIREMAERSRARETT